MVRINQWNLSYPFKNKTTPDEMRSLQQLFPPESKPGMIDIGNHPSLRRLVVEVYFTPIRHTKNRTMEGRVMECYSYFRNT